MRSVILDSCSDINEVSHTDICSDKNRSVILDSCSDINEVTHTTTRQLF